MIQVEIFRGHNGSDEGFKGKINGWLQKYPDIVITNIVASDSSSQHGSRNRSVYIFYETKENISL